MHKILTSLVFLLTLLQAPAQRIKEIIVEADTAGRTITYGTTIHFRFYIITKRKKKEVSWNRIDKLVSFTSMNAECSAMNGTIYFPVKTINKGLSGCQVKVNSVHPDTHCDYTFDIKMNFKEAITAQFQGEKGLTGARGEHGGIPILFRDGKAGGAGANGGDGFPGKNITVRIKKEYDDAFKKEIFYLYVLEEANGSEYIYHCPYPAKGVTISSMGGQGGSGGDGGNGSGGKPANADKAAGNGGPGGAGGNGGNGGKGGKVTVIVHTNASEIMAYLNIVSSGGPGGNGGNGGTGGGGAISGSAGNIGNVGQPGEQGPAFELRVEDF